jgi:hypothetical protein
MTVLTSMFLIEIGFIRATIAAPPAVDPCKLLTPTEIEQVIGKLTGMPIGHTIGNAVTCSYQFSSNNDEFEI